MSEPKSRAALVREVIETMLLAVLTGISVWVGRTLIEHGETLAAHSTMLSSEAQRINNLELIGSRSLGEHAKADDQRDADSAKRLEKLETALTLLSPVPTKLEAITESQKRIERSLEEHTRIK